MASDLPTPPATPLGSKASVYDDSGSAHTSIDHVPNSSSPSVMDEYEVPTAPPSPSLAPRLPARPPQGVPAEYYETDEDVEMDAKDHVPLIEADQGKCAICFLDCTDFSAYIRVAHMNRCWSGFLQRNKEQKELQERLEDLQKKLEMLIAKHKTKVQSATSISGVSAVRESAADESLSTASATAVPPDEYAPSILGPELSTAPSPLLPASIPPTSCLLCTLSLAHLSPINALAHRIYCLSFTDKCPKLCPICTVAFHYPATWDKPDIAWHLHNCQNGGNLSLTERDDFDALVAAWTGCMEIVERAIVGKMDGRAGMRVSEYKKKRDEGWARGEGWYASEKSNLRIGETQIGDGVEIVRVSETWVPPWFRKQRFRRSAYSVLQVPNHGKVFSRFRMQRVEKEVVFEEVEEEEDGEAEDGVTQERTTSKWSLPSTMDIPMLSESRRRSPDSVTSEDTSANEDYVKTRLLAIPAKSSSRPSIFEVQDLDESEKIIRPTAIKVRPASIEDTSTDEIKNSTLPSLRPPPGLHLPLFSFADFDRLLSHSDSSLETHRDADTTQDDETAAEDAVSDSSGSTISDHELSDFYAAKAAAARLSTLQDFSPDRIDGLPVVHSPTALAHQDDANTLTPLDSTEELPIVQLPHDGRTDIASTPPLDTDSPGDEPISEVEVGTAIDLSSECEDTKGKTTDIFPSAKIEAKGHLVLTHNDAAPNKSDDAQEDDVDAREDWCASPARTQAVLVGTMALGSTSPPPSRVPNFFCAPEVEDAGVETYYYPLRGYLHVNLRSSIVTCVSEDMSVEEVEARNRALCIFGGVDDLEDH